MAATAGFKVQCPSCEAMVSVKDPSFIGRKIDCPKCKYRFVVEDPDAPPEFSAACATVEFRNRMSAEPNSNVQANSAIESTCISARGRSLPREQDIYREQWEPEAGDRPRPRGPLEEQSAKATTNLPSTTDDR